ncbi:MAG: hypothetical protein ACYDGY_06210 [Acidimicrobiales bacterium]
MATWPMPATIGVEDVDVADRLPGGTGKLTGGLEDTGGAGRLPGGARTKHGSLAPWLHTALISDQLSTGGRVTVMRRNLVMLLEIRYELRSATRG